MAKTKIRILEDEYTISGQEDSEQLLAAAARVDQVMRTLSRALPQGMPAGKIAILAALNLASELLALERRTQSLESAVNGQALQMLDLLESSSAAVGMPSAGAWHEPARASTLFTAGAAHEAASPEPAPAAQPSQSSAPGA